MNIFSEGRLAIFGFWLSVWSGVVAIICAVVATAKGYPLSSAESMFTAVVFVFVFSQFAAVVLAILGSILKKPRRYDLLVQVLVSVFALSVVFLFILRQVGLL